MKADAVVTMLSLVFVFLVAVLMFALDEDDQMGTVADRVYETTTSTGSGNIVLAGTSNGYRTFASTLPAGVGFYFSMVHQTLNEWIVAEGSLSGGSIVYGAGDVYTSSAGGSASGVPVNFSAGTKDVFITFPAYEHQTKGDLMARASRIVMQ